MWKLKDDSLTYGDFTFKDGNVRRFYSIDWKSKYSKERNRELGLQRLYKLISKHSTQLVRVRICENLTNTILERYSGATRIE
jgi:hypothetical protein